MECFRQPRAGFIIERIERSAWSRWENSLDMRFDLFAEFTFGKIALQKIAPVSSNFRLNLFGFVGDKTSPEMIKVSGAVFREPLRGPNKGMLSIRVPKTSRTVYVTAAEIAAFETSAAAPTRPGNGAVAGAGAGDFASLKNALEQAAE
jgi:hypothetical protein